MGVFRPRFFVDAPVQAGVNLVGLELRLSETDAHHALHVLRLAAGERCEVVVGSRVFWAEFCGDAKEPRVRLGDELLGAEAGARYQIEVGLVQAITKPPLIDYVIEKGTEVGASFFVLVASQASGKGAFLRASERLSRWRRIAEEASKQSKQVVVPRVELAASCVEAGEYLGAGGCQSLVLDPGAACSIRDELQVLAAAPSSLALWIGPESGWTEGELEQFSRLGMRLVKLGQSVLRAETAGPVAVALARFFLGDW